jgi:hypothetical protein
MNSYYQKEMSDIPSFRAVEITNGLQEDEMLFITPGRSHSNFRYETVTARVQGIRETQQRAADPSRPIPSLIHAMMAVLKTDDYFRSRQSQAMVLIRVCSRTTTAVTDSPKKVEKREDYDILSGESRPEFDKREGTQNLSRVLLDRMNFSFANFTAATYFFYRAFVRDYFRHWRLQDPALWKRVFSAVIEQAIQDMHSKSCLERSRLFEQKHDAFLKAKLYRARLHAIMNSAIEKKGPSPAMSSTIALPILSSPAVGGAPLDNVEDAGTRPLIIHFNSSNGNPI